MESLILVLATVVFGILLYLFYRARLQNQGLNKALIIEQGMKKTIAEREKERQGEYLYMLDHSVGILTDLAAKLYDGDIVINGVTNEFKQDLAAVVHVLKSTPVNYFSTTLGVYEIQVLEGEFNGLEILKNRAPALFDYKCIEMITVARLMLNHKIDIVTATNLFVKSLSQD